MLLKYFYDQKLAQASYMVGCQENSTALIIDPARDITPYLHAADAEGLTITQVTETHIHADFVSGARELASATGATLYLSDMGDADWKYAFADSDTILLHDGDSWMLGNIRIEAIHTPGHTPEHLIFQITNTRAGDRPMGLFTGDCLFVGDIGRPDLLETAAGIVGSKEIGARGQFANIQRLKSMPDYLQIWPGHGAGSACGKALGAVPSSTLGYEKLVNPAFHIDSESAFIDWLLADQPETPRYFAHMKKVNKSGPALLSDLSNPHRLTDEPVLAEVVEQTLVIDTRASSAFAGGHLPGTINIPGISSRFSTYVGWYVDFTKPTYLITDEADVPRLLIELRAIGVDDIPGYFTPDWVESADGRVKQITPQQAYYLLHNGAFLLDVRGHSDYTHAHVPGALNIQMGLVPARAAELPRDTPLILQCSSGMRSQIVASLLQARGFTNILNIDGGFDNWQHADLPVEP